MGIETRQKLLDTGTRGNDRLPDIFRACGTKQKEAGRSNGVPLAAKSLPRGHSGSFRWENKKIQKSSRNNKVEESVSWGLVSWLNRLRMRAPCYHTCRPKPA